MSNSEKYCLLKELYNNLKLTLRDKVFLDNLEYKMIFKNICETEMYLIDDFIAKLYYEGIDDYKLSKIYIFWFDEIQKNNIELDLESIRYQLNNLKIKFNELPKLVDNKTSKNISYNSYGNVKNFSLEFNITKTLSFDLFHTDKSISNNKDTLPPITLYYTITLPGQTIVDSNASSVIYQTIPSNGPYSAYKTHYMCEEDYVTPTDYLISFIAHRTYIDSNLGIPGMYNKQVFIIAPPYETLETSNMITAVGNYIDRGTTGSTTREYINYNVTSATGIFDGYKKLIIFYDNSKLTRKVIISS
jgi:hypothetical protein